MFWTLSSSLINCLCGESFILSAGGGLCFEVQWKVVRKFCPLCYKQVIALSPRIIKDKFSLVFSKFSQIALVATRLGQFCDNFENTRENLSLILLDLMRLHILIVQIIPFVFLLVKPFFLRISWITIASGERDAKGELNVPTQNFQSNIAPYKISNYVIKTGNRRLLSPVYASLSTKVQSRYAPNKNILRAHRCLQLSYAISVEFYCSTLDTTEREIIDKQYRLSL